MLGIQGHVASGLETASSPSVSLLGNMVNHIVPRDESPRESNPQGKPVREVVEESGESEGPLVMRGIAVEARADITARESEPTSGWSFVARRHEGTSNKGELVMTQKVDAPLDSARRNQPDRNRHAERVRRLQFRIAKATMEGKWRLVKNLQRLLTHSSAAKMLAVDRVMSNQGRNTPGVDRIVWKTPEDRQKAVESLTGADYQPLPLRRVYIPKRNGSLRPLGIPTMKDRAMQALHLMALIPVAEVTADKDSYGFRPKRSAADAIEQCFLSLARRCSSAWILEFDIKGCFDSISHDWLMTHIPMDKGILRKWLKAGYIDRRRLFPSQAGTPQGGIISACLANMALDGLEEELKRHFRVKDKVNLIRYADDGVVTGVSKELLEQNVLPVIENFMRERGLELSKEKTRIVHITEGFDFLGQNVRKYGPKLLIKPARKNVQSVLLKTEDFLKKAQAFPQESVISVLNPILRGWGNYHCHVVSKQEFGRVDHAVWFMLWQWARRRHPLKRDTWIKDRYFQRIGSRKWVFATLPKGKGAPTHVLFNVSDIPIRRHIKIRKEATPFDPQWTEYFEKREQLKRSGKGRISFLEQVRETTHTLTDKVAGFFRKRVPS